MHWLVASVAVLTTAQRPAQWSEVRGAGFTAQLPGVPKADERELETAAGKLKFFTWHVTSASSYAAVVSAEYPADVVANSTPGVLLKAARNGAVANSGAQLERERQVVIGSGNAGRKWPGLEFFSRVKGKQMKTSTRLYLVDATLFQIILVQSVNSTDTATFKKMVEGFHLVASSAPNASTDADTPVTSLTQVVEEGRKLYSTKGHKKAAGVELEFTYPSTWRVEEGKRPHIVTNIAAPVEEAGFTRVTLLMAPLPPELKKIGVDGSSFVKSMSPEDLLADGAKLRDAKETTVEGLPAWLFQYSMRSTRAGVELDGLYRELVFAFSDRLIRVLCMSVDPASTLPQAEAESDAWKKRMLVANIECTQIFNSIVLPSKWK